VEDNQWEALAKAQHSIPQYQATTATTLYQSYIPNRHVSYYANRLIQEFRNIHGNGSFSYFSIRCSNHHLIIAQSGVIIFQTTLDVWSVRNIYLELFSCHFDVVDFMDKRKTGDFDNENYRSDDNRTPPEPPDNNSQYKDGAK